MEAVDHEVLARFLSAPEARTRPDKQRKKAGSMNALRSSVKGFFGYLHEAGLVSQNPARLVRRAICGTPPPRCMSEDDQIRLLEAMATGGKAADRRDHAMFHLMLATGIRLGSSIGLDVEDVDLEQSEIMLRVTKGDRVERVFLGASIRDHLRIYISDRLTGPLFRSCGKRRLSRRQAQKRFSSWLDIAGIRKPASTHSLRHSFAAQLYHRTGDILLVKEALRHRSIESTFNIQIAW